jgi:hypothetical protein
VKEAWVIKTAYGIILALSNCPKLNCLETSVFSAPGCFLRGGQRQFIGQFSDEDLD